MVARGVVSWEYVDQFGTDRLRALVNVDTESTLLQQPEYEFGSYSME